VTTIAAPVVVLKSKALTAVNDLTNMVGGLRNPFPLDRTTTGLVLQPYSPRRWRRGVLEVGFVIDCSNVGQHTSGMQWLVSVGAGNAGLMVGWYRRP
jgi:hypothetical protein